MKKLLFLLFLSFSMIIDAQTIDYNHFDEKTMNNVMFNTLNHYKYRSRIHFSNKQEKIYNYIKENNEKIFVDSLITRINLDNEYVVKKFVAIIANLPCDNITTYKEIANRCVDIWSNPDDSFFRDKWGEKVMIISYYNSRTNMIYIVSAFK